MGTDLIDPAEIMERHWPYDGPHTDEKVTTAAEAVALLVRYLCNATYQPTRYASATNSALGSLSAAMYELEHLCRQFARGLQQHADDPLLYDDRGDRPGRNTAEAAATTLLTLRVSAVELAQLLNEAHGYTSHLGHDISDDRDDGSAGGGW